MKKLLKLTLILFIASTVLYSCKKGKNDPFISLKSRKARLTGTWELSSGNITDKFTSSNFSQIKTRNYDGNFVNETITTNSNGITSTSSSNYIYTFEITFDKKETFNSTENDNGDITKTEGNWAFLNKSKSADLKNKEAIVLSTTKETGNGNIKIWSGKSLEFGQIYVIDQLKNKEMIILFDRSYTDKDGDTWETTGSFTFTKK